ncbi:MAG: hypothetical protein ACW97A_01020 [Candidatus Thorarchaeota archaeon]|jgi:hypothetical protein
MEIPILTRFIEGLKLFFESKRLRWLTLIFFIAAISFNLFERIGILFPLLAAGLTFIGGIYPVYFLLIAIISIFGLQRFVASDESYARSLVLLIPWMAVSVVLYVISWVFFAGIFVLIIGFAFLGWIGFQAYFSTRSSLGYAESIDVGHRSKVTHVLFLIVNFFNYAVIVGAFIGTLLFVSNIVTLTFVAWGGAILGMFFALGFNFLNGLIIAAERNKKTADNLTLLGLFISLYSAYFIYNILKGVDLQPDLVDLAISIFFIFYTMSGIGRTLASRADLDTRFKISKELAASFTFFLATGFMFLDTSFEVIFSDPSQAAPVADVVKLLIFPLIALMMELLYIRSSRREPAPVEVPDELLEFPEEEEVSEEAEPEEIEPSDESIGITPEEPESVEEDYIEEEEETEESLEEDYSEEPVSEISPEDDES